MRFWDPWLRLFHWALAGMVVANRFFTEAGELWHERLGYVACAAIGWRLVWGFVGPETARFSVWVRQWPERRRVATRLLRDLRGQERRSLHHSPLAQLGMVLMLLLVLALGFTGWMMSWDRFFGEEWLESLHWSLSQGLTLLVAVHVAGVLRASVHRRENLVASMVHGRKRR